MSKQDWARLRRDRSRKTVWLPTSSRSSRRRWLTSKTSSRCKNRFTTSSKLTSRRRWLKWTRSWPRKTPWSANFPKAVLPSLTTRKGRQCRSRSRRSCWKTWRPSWQRPRPSSPNEMRWLKNWHQRVQTRWTNQYSTKFGLNLNFVLSK